MTWEGFTDKLQTPYDLVGKLRRDLERLRANPRDVDAAFDFVVTADAVVEWFAPGDAGQLDRRTARLGDPMKTVHHLASGAKHFRAERRHHNSVKDVSDRPGAFDPAAFQADAFDVGGVVVERADGTEVGIVKFAEQVLWWLEQLLEWNTWQPSAQ